MRGPKRARGTHTTMWTPVRHTWGLTPWGHPQGSSIVCMSFFFCLWKWFANISVPDNLFLSRAYTSILDAEQLTLCKCIRCTHQVYTCACERIRCVKDASLGRHNLDRSPSLPAKLGVRRDSADLRLNRLLPHLLVHFISHLHHSVGGSHILM